MKKRGLKRVIDSIPSALNNVASWIKDNYEDNAQDIIKNASGSVGLLVKLAGTPILNKYIDNLSAKRLDNYGFHTYMKAAYNQASNSVEAIKEELKSDLTPQEIIDIFSKITVKNINEINEDNLILIFQPKYHPVVNQIRNNYESLLYNLNGTNTLVNQFKKDFNENITEEVEKSFGDDYVQHLKDVTAFLTEKNEAELLWDTINLGIIGFDSKEDLKYETAFGEWKEVSKFNNEEKEGVEVEKEESLKPVTTLIDEYFSIDPKNNLEKILFLVADFGKGKSVFLRQYAAKLAKQYLETKNGYFPIYFNLRNFSQYQQDTRLGVLSDYLLTKYGISIDSDYYKKKKYVFLIDSLDESGELNKSSIEKVMNSIKQIQQIDKEKYRTNKIIVTSRPFSEGLDYQLKGHAPFCKKNKEKRDIEYFISLYGFKKDQFNDWLYTSLKNVERIVPKDRVKFFSEIFKNIDLGKKIDIHSQLLENNTLTASELRRPIFGYMIYQLIINNIDFLKVGKIGVYLSFLNLLTKEAKHIKDPSYKVSLKEEFEFRNLLHATSALWMFERHKGNQGFLNKADLCRVLDGTDKQESDNQIIERYKKQGVVEIEFLSHSYFGESDNMLHFQHQSFAEILLAEYYLKVFIKYALDEDASIEEARSKLLLGTPTEQTINFFIELLELLLYTSQDDNSQNVIEKRKLLFPLLASIATNKNNNLFSNDVFYEWYKLCKLDDNQSDYPYNSLVNWYFNEEKILKIVNLAKEVLNSNDTFIIASAETKSSLYNNELLLVQNEKLSNLTHDIDRWLSLLVGNILYNDLSQSKKPKLFNWDYNIDPMILFDLIKIYELSTTRHSRDSDWRKALFKGINMGKTESRAKFYSVLNNFDFSYSYLKNLDLSGSLLGHTNFNYCRLENVTFSHCYFWSPMFDDIKSLENCMFESIIVSDIFVPGLPVNNNSYPPVFIPQKVIYADSYSAINCLIDLLHPIIKYFKNEKKSNQDNYLPKFIFESKEQENKFMKAIHNGKHIIPSKHKSKKSIRHSQTALPDR